MFLDDALENYRRAGVIPDAIRVNDRDRPAQADAQAVDLAAINERLRADEMELLEACLEEFPRSQRLLARRAFRLGLVRAEEDMTGLLREAERFGGGEQGWIGCVGHGWQEQGLASQSNAPRWILQGRTRRTIPEASLAVTS